MAVFVITAIRRDLENHRVTHVRWGRANASNNSWEFTPREAPVIDVVDALMRDDTVTTVFKNDAGWTPGEDVRVVVYEHGLEGIESVDSIVPGKKTLNDLPIF
jgi:hypothetical protein